MTQNSLNSANGHVILVHELFGPSTKNSFIHDAIGDDLVEIEDSHKAQVRYLTMQNGLYDLANYQLVPHDPGIFTTNLLPYDYDPDAECQIRRPFSSFRKPYWNDDNTIYGADGFIVEFDTQPSPVPVAEPSTLFHPILRFFKLPCDPGRSDFPSPVLTVAFPLTAFPQKVKLKCQPIYTPSSNGLPVSIDPYLMVWFIPALCPGPVKVRHVPRASLPDQGITSFGVMSHASRQRALPLLQRSYGLMRQTKTLLPTSTQLIRQVLCRLLPVPAGRWSFPTLSLQSLHRCPDPYPGMPLWCQCPFLPRELQPHLRCTKFGTSELIVAMQLQRRPHFRNGSHSVMFRLPCLLAPQIAPTAQSLNPVGCQGLYAAQWTGGYPPEQWYRYMTESDHDHGGTFTRWIEALSAATCNLGVNRHHNGIDITLRYGYLSLKSIIYGIFKFQK